jgi:hypothetical protein
MNDELMKEVDFRKLMDEEKKARLDNEALKGAQICVKLVNISYIKITMNSWNTFWPEVIIILYVLFF